MLELISQIDPKGWYTSAVVAVAVFILFKLIGQLGWSGKYIGGITTRIWKNAGLGGLVATLGLPLVLDLVFSPFAALFGLKSREKPFEVLAKAFHELRSQVKRRLDKVDDIAQEVKGLSATLAVLDADYDKTVETVDTVFDELAKLRDTVNGLSDEVAAFIKAERTIGEKVAARGKLENTRYLGVIGKLKIFENKIKHLEQFGDSAVKLTKTYHDDLKKLDDQNKVLESKVKTLKEYLGLIGQQMDRINVRTAHLDSPTKLSAPNIRLRASEEVLPPMGEVKLESSHKPLSHYGHGPKLEKKSEVREEKQDKPLPWWFHRDLLSSHQSSPKGHGSVGGGL